MDADYQRWLWGKTAERCVKTLNINEFDAHYMPDLQTAAAAISATGEIVNVDGIGNRTNAMTFGTRKVVIVAGMNKVTPDLNSALKRVSEVAAPMRARSLNMQTPCAENGRCTDCKVPQRMCRITTILHRKPLLTDISVFLIGQSLGF